MPRKAVTMIIANLRFQKLTAASVAGEEWGELTLDTDGRVVLSVSDSLKSRFLRTADRVDKAALLYGSSVFMGTVTLGAALVLKRKTVWGYLLFLLSAALAVVGSQARSAARNVPNIFDTYWNKEDVSVAITPDGDLTIRLSDKRRQGILLRVAPGEYNLANATAFSEQLRVEAATADPR